VPGRRATIATVEAAYQDARLLKDQIDVTRSRGADRNEGGVALADLVAQYRAARARLEALSASVTAGGAAEDRRALEIMRRALEGDLDEETAPEAGAAAPEEVACDYDPRLLAAGADAFRTLSDRMYECFGRAAGHLPFDGQVLDRLTVFSLLPLTDDPGRRRRLFLALEPVWRSINGDNGPASPYRSLVRLSAARHAERRSSIEGGVASLGIDPAAIEGWLVRILETWRDTTPRRSLEPWDFAHAAGAMSRALSRRVPREDLRPLNDRFYGDLGASPEALNVRYDIEPRTGKDPVAFTTFGARPGRDDGAFRPAEPWVFAAYRVGGVDNLAELLHETGHAVHIAAIRTRPAFTDWPDSTTFTEAVADLAALEMYEPAWQRRYLEGSVPLPDALRAKYSGIVLDTAWALLEIRLHRDPEQDPNRIWSEITAEYLRIRPHPGLSWWAMRGQLVNAPGYMLNYAAGAILAADLRARVRELRGPIAQGDPGWYDWVSERLYHFGLERPAREVVEEFLGRPVAPDALLDDMARARPR
jgi:hypothetical protein